MIVSERLPVNVSGDRTCADDFQARSKNDWGL